MCQENMGKKKEKRKVFDLTFDKTLSCIHRAQIADISRQEGFQVIGVTQSVQELRYNSVC